jgi:sugar phosphate permease
MFSLRQNGDVPTQILQPHDEISNRSRSGLNRSTFFAVSWATYVAFYLCRQNLGVILPVFAKEHLYSTFQSAHLVLAFSIAYCVGQFLVGGLVDLFSAKKILVTGMMVSALATGAMGFSNHYRNLVALQIVNGISQASGWVGLMKLMKRFPMQKRGVVMGWWSTNYVVGGFAATLLASSALASTRMTTWGWRPAAWIPAISLFLYAIFFTIATRGVPDEQPESVDSRWRSWFRAFKFALSMNRIRYLMGAFFFVKLIRYSLLFWLPLWMVSQLGLSPVRAGYTTSWMGAVGVVGVLGAAYLSDYVFREQRFPVAMWMMLLLVAGCLAASKLRAGSANWGVAVVVGLLGCATYGADTLLIGAATQDAAGTKDIGKIAGIVDGAGSIGQILSPLFVAILSKRFGWPAMFQALSFVALLCAGVLAAGRDEERKDEVVWS